MEAHTHAIARVFSDGGYIQYILPHFQREYTWETKDWQTLLDDAYTIYDEYDYQEDDSDRNRPEHFMGSLVRIGNGARNGITTFTLVDGQQRLTTVSLLLCALCSIVRENNPALARGISRMLINPDEINMSKYKLLPTTKHGDQVTYIEIVDAVTAKTGLDGFQTQQTDSNILPAYQYLHDQLSAKVADGTIEAAKFFATLMRCFGVVTIDLKLEEQPYKIFESLNAKGKALTPADLVRNFVAMTLPDTMQNEVFEKHWSVIDNLLREKEAVGSSRVGELTGFLRHYLAACTETLYSVDYVYERFRDRVRREFPEPKAFVDEIARLHRLAGFYDKFLRPQHEPGIAISSLLSHLQILEMSTAFPLLLSAYEAYDSGQIASGQFIDLLNAVENYAVRFFICGRRTNALNTMFPTIWAGIDRNRFSESSRELLATKNYPTDQEVRNSIRFGKMDTRNAKRVVFVLATVNRHLSLGSGAYTVLDGNPTLEHILPQKLSGAWEIALGDESAVVHQEHLDTLGNLTLVTQAWNSSLSNSPFGEKKPRLAENGLRLNRDYFTKPIHQWNRDAILARADWLAENVLEIWPALDTPDITEAGAVLRPLSVTILGVPHAVTSWSDVMHRTAETVSEWVGSESFPSLAERYPRLFSREPFKYRPRKLNNGWWVYVNLSRIDILRYCKTIVAAAGIPEAEWSVEEST